MQSLRSSMQTKRSRVNYYDKNLESEFGKTKIKRLLKQEDFLK